MSSEGPDLQQSPTTPNAKRDRIQSLRDMAHDVYVPQESAESFQSAPRREKFIPARTKRMPNTLWLSAAGAILAVIIVSVIVARTLPWRQGASVPPSNIIGIAPQANGINHPVAVTWSPDGSQIAIVGYLGSPLSDPNQYQYAPGVVAIYQVKTGRLVTITHLDDIIAGQVALKPPTVATPAPGETPLTRPVIDYSHILWSASGSTLALTFRIDDYTSQTSVNFIDGAIIMHPDGTHAHVFTYAHTDTPPAVNVWTIDGAHTQYPVPTSYQYAWDTTDTLTGTHPLLVDGSTGAGSASGVKGPIGDPNGGQTFSMWQAGSVTLNTTGGRPISGIFDWNASFAAWSPDSKRIVQNVSPNGLFVLAADDSTLATAQRLSASEHEPLLTTRDAGLKQALSALNSGELSGNMAESLFSWSPDGKWLAAQFIPNSPTSKSSDYQVIIFNCATGERAATLLPELSLNQSMDGSTLLSWSPDGKRILLLDAQLGTVTIWSMPAALLH